MHALRRLPSLSRALARPLSSTAVARDRPSPAPVSPPPDASYDPRERAIHEKLARELEPVTRLVVQDISGGCGAQYAIEVVSPRFAGLTMLKQQRMVNEVLKEEIKGWHGLRLSTSAPK
ncbi:bola protein [Hyaloraphidium curvatum]|nr:bola protein [Hyaloraphidium curvatum]